MDTTMTNTDEQQQLIHMSPLSPVENLNDTNIVLMREINNIEKRTSPELKQPTFLFSLFSWPIEKLTSLHLPHLSDRLLRTIFLLFITLIGLTSFAIALIVGTSVVQFKQQCPLYASFKFQTFITSESNWTVKISSEEFGAQSTCDFCTFYNVFTFIYCIMTGFFFILFNGDHRIMATNDRCLIIPW
jgi:hypothetical protein